MIDEEEEEKERKRLKTQKVKQALNDNLDEEPDWSPPEANKIEEPEKKLNRLRRPEVKNKPRRDEL